MNNTILTNLWRILRQFRLHLNTQSSHALHSLLSRNRLVFRARCRFIRRVDDVNFYRTHCICNTSRVIDTSERSGSGGS